MGRWQWRNPALRRAFEWCADRLREQDDVIQKGPGRGLRFNAGRSNAGYILGTSEPGLQTALTRLLRPGLTMYDVGANVGFLTVIGARLVGREGRVVAFEPVRPNADLAAHNARLNGFDQVEILCVALGREDGEASFLLSANSNWGKFKSAGGVADPIAETTVPVRSLDSLAREGGQPEPDLMKIDVEGAEVDVIAGAARMLRKKRPVLLVELHGTNEAVDEELRALGYRPSVLGSHQPLPHAPWDSQVVAVPEERVDLNPLIAQLCDPDLMGRIR